MTTHITPLNDLRPHIDSTACDCQPRVTWYEGDMIVIHNSWDGREGLELAMEVLDGE